MENDKVVCVIDDDSTFQKMMNLHLTSMGFVVRSFFSGRELETINERPYAILLDHHLGEPDETGLDVLKRLKKKMPRVPVIYMTGENDSSVRLKAKKWGVFEYIEKTPSSLVVLRTALDRIAAGGDNGNWLSRFLRK